MSLQGRIVEEILKLRQTDFSSLSRIEEFGTQYNFSEAAGTLEAIFKDLTELETNAEIIRVSDKKQDHIFTIAQQSNELVSQIQQFVVKGNEGNATAQHEDIHRRVRELEQRCLDEIVPLLDTIEFKKTKPLELESEVKKVRKFTSDMKGILAAAEKDKQNFDSTLKEIRDSLGKEASTFSATDFHDQAIEHEKASKNWLIVSVAAIAIFIFVAIILFFNGAFKLTGSDYARIAQVGIFKVVILSAAYIFVHQSIKNYKINNHLYVVNKHRQLALKVYPLMTGASTSPEHSNIILGNAAKAIFDQSSTGYLDGKDDTTNPINLTEVINKFVDKGTNQ